MSLKDGWRITDELWMELEPLLLPRKRHPLGCHNPRVPDRKAMDGLFFALRTGCQWNALNGTGICSSSSAHRRFQEWTGAGVFRKLWKRGLFVYDRLKGIDRRWLSMDGAMTKAPLGGGETGSNPTDRAKGGTKRSLLTEADGIPVGLAIAAANRNDFKRFNDTVRSVPGPRPKRSRRRGICLDKGGRREDA
jgi:transposase